MRKKEAAISRYDAVDICGDSSFRDQAFKTGPKTTTVLPDLGLRPDRQGT
jgi:hypothetical protein